MSASHDEDSNPLSKVLRVRQAASTLGISERTVYRRLRSGKLEQLPTEIPITDNVMTNVSEVTMTELIASEIEHCLEKMACQNDMTNDMTNDKLSALRQELAIRDAQIQSLLENQKELTLTIQKLQAQIYELARLALLQQSRGEEKSTDVPVAIEPPPTKRNGRLRRLLRTIWERSGDQ